MKKFLLMLLALVLVCALASCGDAGESKSESQSESETTPAVTVMDYATFMAADDDTPVVIESYVQAKQSWWNNKATVYLQDEVGAYFAYEMVCSEEDYALLTPGTKVRITGYKTSWQGEVEIASGCTFEILDGNYVAPAVDVTALLGTEDLITKENYFVSFTGLTVAASKLGAEDAAFLYNWDGSGTPGNDLYFNVSDGTNTYTFTVESYLCDKDTDVYKAVEALKIGDTVNMEGFLYWYNGANPHITKVTVVTAD